MRRPGVYVLEEPLPRVVSAPVPVQSYGAFIGTALKGPTSPTRVDTWADFSAIFGDFSTNLTLPVALYQYFSNGGGPAYVSRVLPTTGAVAASADYTTGATPDPVVVRINFYASTSGAWGDNLRVFIETNNTSDDESKRTFNLIVKLIQRGAAVQVESYQNLSMVTTSSRYFVSIINSQSIGSRYVRVVDVLVDDEPLAEGTQTVDGLEFTGGADGDLTSIDAAAYSEAVEKFDEIDALLVFNLPHVSASKLTDIDTYVKNRGDSLLVIDPDENATPSDMVAGTNLPSNNDYASVYYPWLYIPDPSPGSTRGSVMKVPPGASAVGTILRIDRERGVAKAPAGVGASLNNVVSVERRLTNAELDDLADANINVMRPLPNIGVAIMGARTRSYGTIGKYLSVRRTLNYVKKMAVEASRFALFEPNTPSLWEQLRVNNGSFLSEMWSIGQLAGIDPTEAYYVKCDADLNTPTAVANGEVYVEIGVAPVFPAEFVIIRVGQFESDASIVVTEGV